MNAATQNLIQAAKDLDSFLGRNAGDNADWPIEITADKEHADELCKRLNALQAAVREVEE